MVSLDSYCILRWVFLLGCWNEVVKTMCIAGLNNVVLIGTLKVHAIHNMHKIAYIIHDLVGLGSNRSPCQTKKLNTT